ncbi:MAG: transposase domain-containing protein [Alphaproteobacteria bacterium]
MAKLNNAEPYAYLNDMLEPMTHGHPIICVDDLMPWHWKWACQINLSDVRFRGSGQDADFGIQHRKTSVHP